MQRYNAYASNPVVFDENEQNVAWEAYVTLFHQWRNELMVNILGVEQYYGAEKRNQFEGHIQYAFASLHACLQSMREPALDQHCKFASAEDKQKAFEQLNLDLYCFASGLPDPDKGTKCWFER